MIKPTRFILGRGERLVTPQGPPPSTPNKEYPYSLDEAYARLGHKISGAVSALKSLPQGARPGNQAVAELTMHPRGIAKSYSPRNLLRDFDLRLIGSKSIKLVPEKDTVSNPREAEGTQLYVAGEISSFEHFAEATVEKVAARTQASQKILRLIEDFSAPDIQQRIQPIPSGYGTEGVLPFEVVLHQQQDRFGSVIADGFEDYLESLEAQQADRENFQVGALNFIPIWLESDRLHELAEFAFLRTVRVMPKLRAIDTVVRVSPLDSEYSLELPEPIEETHPRARVTIFDGGLAKGSSLARYANSFDAPDLSDPLEELFEHGHSVTSAVLFGTIDPRRPLTAPQLEVDHYRVLDNRTGEDPFELYAVLARIKAVLDDKKPEFFNLSLGPSVPVEDNEVHAWTAVLDSYLFSERALGTVAVGNTGHISGPESRVQVPSDSVNSLCVGAANSTGLSWQRSEYSSVGPGRRPGVVKPDLLAFGGEQLGQPFIVADQKGTGFATTAGTSFAAPSTINTVASLRTRFGAVLTPVALRALLIHTAEDNGNKQECGWGRARTDIDNITICSDGMVRVLYQGEFSPGQTVRAKVPLPKKTLSGLVTIKATLVFMSEVDPEDPSNYTQTCIVPVFRPHHGQINNNPEFPKTDTLFPRNEYGSEHSLRENGHKWETVLQGTTRKRGSSLQFPVIDFQCIGRENSNDGVNKTQVPYALVVTIEAPAEHDLYEQVFRENQTTLEEIRPQATIQIEV